jgi:hypothetical protein
MKKMSRKGMKTKMKKEEGGKIRENLSKKIKIKAKWAKVKAKRVRE